MHNWALWRALMIAVIALPFLVVALLSGRRERRSDASHIGVNPVDKTQVQATAIHRISKPGAWRVVGDGRFDRGHGNDGAAVVDKRAA
jgi:hypothetical protein